MRMLITGASSGLGRQLLRAILARDVVEEAYCTVHRSPLDVADARIRPLSLDLRMPIDLGGLPPLDVAVHAAGLTHSADPGAYAAVNRDGTGRLAAALSRHGCRRMLYLSTRALGAACGAYGESKQEAERALASCGFESLVLLRPAEVYGAGREGIDAFLALARRWRIVPWLFGDRRIRFAPLHVSDFVRASVELLLSQAPGVRTVELCGPEVLTGTGLAFRLARQGVVPIPVFWPLVGPALGVLRAMGAAPGAPDQAARLLGPKSSERSSDGLPAPVHRFPGPR